jgi:hypothetical protein
MNLDAHYKKRAIEPIVPIKGFKLGFCEGNAFKYIDRHNLKDGLKDVAKAKSYLKYCIEDSSITLPSPFKLLLNMWRFKDWERVIEDFSNKNGYYNAERQFFKKLIYACKNGGKANFESCLNEVLKIETRYAKLESARFLVISRFIGILKNMEYADNLEEVFEKIKAKSENHSFTLDNIEVVSSIDILSKLYSDYKSSQNIDRIADCLLVIAKLPLQDNSRRFVREFLDKHKDLDKFQIADEFIVNFLK